MSVMSKRKKYGEQFKAEAVELVLITGRSIVEVAGELGVNPGTLGELVASSSGSESGSGEGFVPGGFSPVESR